MADGRPVRSGRAVHRSLVRVHGVPAPACVILEAAPRLIERLLDDDAQMPAHASDVELPHPRFLVEVLLRPGQIRTMRDGQFLTRNQQGDPDVEAIARFVVPVPQVNRHVPLPNVVAVLFERVGMCSNLAGDPFLRDHSVKRESHRRAHNCTRIENLPTIGFAMDAKSTNRITIASPWVPASNAIRGSSANS